MNIPPPFPKASARLKRATLLLLALCLPLAAPAAAQQREHLTPEEIELVRDNQELDARTKVFITAAESPLLRKSLYMLAEATNKMLPELTKLREAAQSEAEADQLDRALETAREITDAAKEKGVTAEDLKAKAKAATKKND